MSRMRDRLKQGLNETRTVVLGVQILLGIQYQALFQPRFAALPTWLQRFEPVAFGLLIVVLAMLIAPTPRHRLVEHGDLAHAQCAYVDRMLTLALAPLAAAIGADVVLTTSASLGAGPALALGATVMGAAVFAWFGVETMRRSKTRATVADGDETVSMREKIDELLTESRIVLPGVLALLGFQFTAYLTDAFDDMAGDMQAAHTAGLVLLLAAMILLMTPAPYHRLAERGEDTARFEKIGTALVLWALAPLALGLACDFYVALRAVGGGQGAAGATAGLSGAAVLLLWFAAPLKARMARHRETAASGEHVDHPERA